jgi:hypothetical protein
LSTSLPYLKNWFGFVFRAFLVWEDFLVVWKRIEGRK